LATSLWRAARAHKINQTAATTPIRKKKPPTAPPAMGAASLEEFDADCETWLCEAVGTGTTLRGGVEVEVTVTTVTTPSWSVDDSCWVTTVGEGVVVTKRVVSVDDGRDDDREGLCPGVCDDPVLVKEQGAKSVLVGLTSVMILVTITGTDTVESPPVHVSI
jgi:hypothetical protein